MGDLVLHTIDDVKTWLKIVGKTKNQILELIIPAVDQACVNYTDRKFQQETYIDYLDGSGTDEIRLPQWPIISITSLHIDGNYEFDAGSLVDSANYDFYDEAGIIVLIKNGGVFTKGKRNVKVVWPAGYAEIPRDLALANAYFTSQLFKDSTPGGARQGKTSITLRDGDVELLDVKKIPEFTRLVWDKYRRKSII